MMLTEAQKRARKKYQSKVVRYVIELYPTDTDLIEHINKQPVKQSYIKDLIRADMEKQKKGLCD